MRPGGSPVLYSQGVRRPPAASPLLVGRAVLILGYNPLLGWPSPGAPAKPPTERWQSLGHSAAPTCAGRKRAPLGCNLTCFTNTLLSAGILLALWSFLSRFASCRTAFSAGRRGRLRRTRRPQGDEDFRHLGVTGGFSAPGLWPDAASSQQLQGPTTQPVSSWSVPESGQKGQ